MRNLTLSVALVLLTLATLAIGQDTSSEFVSGIARFGFKPGLPIVGANADEGLESGYYVPGETFTFSDGATVIAVSHFTPIDPKNWTPEFPASGKAKLVESSKKTLIADFAKSGAAFKESAYMSGSIKGVEIEVSGSRKSVVRLFFVASRFYILFATAPHSGSFDNLRSALNTFRYLSKEEFAAAIIREMMPAQLPQDTPTGILPTDAIEMALKGRVKSIIEDIEYPAPRKRERLSETHYGNTGFITRKITFAAGYADVINNYGWVDGRRAVNVGPLKYLGEPIGRGTATMTVGIGAREGYNYLGRDMTGQIVDRRYTSRFEEKYDDSWRLTERKNVSSNGDVNFVERHTYSGPTRTVRVEDDAGGFLSGKKETLDEAGNVVEEQTLDNRGKPIATIRFKYQFDVKGNWVVKTATVVSRVAAPKGTRHQSTYYRSITYLD